MQLWLQVLTALIGLCLAFWMVSILLVLATPVAPDPWRSQMVLDGGETIRASDGAELYVRHWLPQNHPKQIIIALHGLGQHSGYHRRFGAALAECGRAYYALDIRGNGLTKTTYGDIPSIKRLYADLDEVIQIFQRRHTDAQVYVLGHSMGAAMAVTWAAERKPEIEGLVILSPAMTATAVQSPWLNYLKGPAAWLFFSHRPVLKIGKAAYARERLSAVINIPAEIEFISADPLQLKGMSMQYALAANHFRKSAVELASHVQVSTFILVGQGDPARTGAEKLYAALTIPDKELVVEPDIGHLLFHIQEMPLIVEKVATWLQQHAEDMPNSSSP